MLYFPFFSYVAVPESFIEKTVFSPLYILASFILDKLSINVWVYFWTFYPEPFSYVLVFVPVLYCSD